jgi:hypothetical protein
VGWRFGTLAVYYDPDTFEPLPSAVQRWQSTARELWSTIKDSCPTTSTKFFAAGGPQTPATTTPPRRVAGWAAPGVRTLCLVSDATFAGSPVSRQQILDATSLDAGLKARRILLAPPGQPCDATLTVAFTGSALSAEYVGAGRLYTGATMSGRLTLAATDLPNLVIPVSHRENPPGTTSEFRSSLPQTPADAFHHLGLADAVGAALDQWFGPT